VSTVVGAVPKVTVPAAVAVPPEILRLGAEVERAALYQVVVNVTTAPDTDACTRT